NYTYNAGNVYGTSYLGGLVGQRAGGTIDNSFSDYSKIEVSPNVSGRSKPTTIVGSGGVTSNSLNLTHGEMIDTEAMFNALGAFSISDWVFTDNNGTVAYYPQLRKFTSGKTSIDSLSSV